ncbi:MAG: hypothetical protein ACK4NR_03505 [Micavibrio sp.]
MTDHTQSEHHFKTVPGKLFGIADVPLRLQFASAPFLPDNTTGVLELSSGDPSDPVFAPLPAGKSGLSVIAEDLDLQINEEDVAQIQNELNIPATSARHMLMVHKCDELAKTIAAQFFQASEDIDPTLRIKPVVNEDGTVQAKKLQIIMTGRSNKHPFWNPGGSF